MSIVNYVSVTILLREKVPKFVMHEDLFSFIIFYNTRQSNVFFFSDEIPLITAH